MNKTLFDRLLSRINIITDEEKNTFLFPDFDRDTHDPMLLPNVEKAITRLKKALLNNEKIVIYSDYDADGIPGGVILHDFFKKISYENFTNYIPHRHDEGFGLNVDAIQKFIDEKVNLIITIDCGITDIKEVALARNAGIDVIITDHHEPHEELPDAFAIVDPKLKDSIYPYKELCGAAVIYKVIDAFIKSGYVFEVKKDWVVGSEKWFLDMVGIATLSDMVPLTGENRVLAHYGLKVLRKMSRSGVQKLLSSLRIDQKLLSEDDVVFMISPRINAASRMAHPVDAFNALIYGKVADSLAAADFLIKLNDRRKIETARLAKEIIKREAEYIDKPIVVIGNPDWKPGVLGLAANSIVEKSKKTAFVWGREDSPTIKGSVRAAPGESVVEIMRQASLIDPEIFITYGGHIASGGFSVSPEKIHELENTLLKAYQKYLDENKINNSNEVTQNKNEEIIAVEISDLTDDFIDQLAKLAPFGMANPKPLFTIINTKVFSINYFGKSNEHIDVVITDGNDVPKTISCISFFADKNDYREIKEGTVVSIQGALERSYFGGRAKNRIRITGISLGAI